MTDFDIALDLLQEARDDLRRRENGRNSGYIQIFRVRLQVIHAGFEALYGSTPRSAEDRPMRVPGGVQV